MRIRFFCVAALCAVSVAVLIRVLAVSADRVGYPFELSKMEGHFVDHARLLAAGEPIYRAPSAEFVPLLYTPLSHHAGAWLMRAGLDDFAATRIVGIAGVLGALALGMALAARAAPGRWPAALVAPLAASKYFAVQCFYDQTRPDNLMSFFCIAAVASLALRRTALAAGAFALSATLAVLTKQPSLLFLVLLLAGVASFDRRRALLAGGAFAVSGVAAFASWNAATDGWLYTYTVTLAGHHVMRLDRLGEILASHFLGEFGFTTVAAVLAACAVVFSGSLRGLAADERGRLRLLLLVAALAAAAFSGASILQPLAMKNVFVLYAIAGATFLPVAVAWGLELVEPPRRRELATNLVLLGLCAVLLQGFQSAKRFRPAPEDQVAWQEFRHTLRSYGPPERAWVMLHGSVWGDRSGVPTRVFLGALSDYVGGFFGESTGNPLPRDLVEKIESRYFRVIVAANWDDRAKRLIRAHYRPDRAPPVQIPAFSGYRPAKESFWVPRARPGGAGGD